MNIHLVIFVSSAKDHTVQATMMKTFKSDFRPAIGDIIEDPGFDPGFHNGYEVVKVSINYALHECFVSLKPLVMETEEIAVKTYLDKLAANGWHPISKSDFEAKSQG